MSGPDVSLLEGPSLDLLSRCLILTNKGRNDALSNPENFDSYLCLPDTKVAIFSSHWTVVFYLDVKMSFSSQLLTRRNSCAYTTVLCLHGRSDNS